MLGVLSSMFSTFSSSSYLSSFGFLPKQQVSTINS